MKIYAWWAGWTLWNFPGMCFCCTIHHLNFEMRRTGWEPLKEAIEFWDLTYFDLALTFPWVKQEMNAAIKLFLQNYKKVVSWCSCNIFIWWPYLTWPWPLLTIRPIPTFNLLHSLGSLLAKLGFAAVISPVPVANKVKRDYSELWPDLDLTRDLFWEIFTKKNSLKSTP